MKRRTIELLKTLLIAVLLLSALTLTLLSNVFGDPMRSPVIASLIRPFAGLLGYTVPEQPVLLDKPTLTDAATPQLITARTAMGRASWYADASTLNAAFDALGSFLASALDTAEAPQQISRRQFLTALSEPGVYFEYPCVLPTNVLAAWLDADLQSDLAAASYVLHLDDSAVMLLLCDGGEYYQFTTQVVAATLFAALDSYPDDGTFFASESQDTVYARLDPLTLIAPGAVSLQAVQAANPCDEAFIAKAANTLGFNPYGDASYRDETGAVIYSESDCTLRVSTDGALQLRNLSLSSRYLANSARDADLIEYVRQTLSELTGTIASDGYLQLTQFVRTDDAVTVQFGYFIAGMPVRLSGGSAVEAVFAGDTLSSLTVRMRAYTLDAAQQLSCLPVRQAAAIAPPSSLMLLQYTDDASGALTAGWTT